MIIITRDEVTGVAWAAAPCGCALALPRTEVEMAGYLERMPRFIDHATDGPCPPKFDENRDETIESRR